MIMAQNVLAAFEMPEGMFLAYIGALAISGFLLLVAAALPGESAGSRVINVVLAAGALGYAFYLLFLFEGTEFRIFLYVFAVPFFALFRIFQAIRAAAKNRGGAAAAQHAYAQPTEPAPQGQGAVPAQQPSGAYYPPQQPGGQAQ